MVETRGYSSLEKFLTFDNKSKSMTWENFLGFDDGSENDYWISGKKSDNIVLKDELCNFTDKVINVYCKPKQGCYGFLDVDKKDDADITIWINPKTKCLFATRNCHEKMFYKSHLKPNGAEMEKGKEVEIFCHEKLFDTLLSQKDIDFDPSDAVLKFGDVTKEGITLTITSRASGGLFASLIRDPFSSFYQALKFDMNSFFRYPDYIKFG